MTLCTDIYAINAAVKLTTVIVIGTTCIGYGQFVSSLATVMLGTDDVIGLQTNSLLLFQFMAMDPTSRLGARGDTRSILKHPFFRTVRWEAVFQKRITPPVNPLTLRVSIMCCVFIFWHKGCH